MRSDASLRGAESPPGARPRIAKLEQAVGRDGELILTFSGEWTVNVPLPPSAPVIGELAKTPPPERVVLAVEGLDRWDSALLAFIRRLEADCRDRGVAVDRGTLPGGMKRLLDLAGPIESSRTAPGRRTSLIARIGNRALRAGANATDSITLVGEVAIGLARSLTAKADLRRSDLIALIQQCGADALPISAVISLLIGMTIAFIGAIQLTKFGATIYVADLVTIAMLREMAPVMTGIVLAGRTGAAFAAQIGTMQGNEEVDALSTLGIRPAEFLVLPRVVALALMTPILTLYADAAGIGGGVVVALSSLSVTPEAYLLETQHAATMTNLVIGLIKGLVFGVLVGFTGCRRGLAAARSAAGVGEATTSAVVSSILQIIIADSLFAVALSVLGI